MLCSKDNDGVHLLSRNRKDATSWFPEIIPSLHALPGSFILDGEVCVVDDREVPDFEKSRGLAPPREAGGAHVVLFAFDLLAWRGKDLRALPLVERKKRLAELLAKNRWPS